MKILLINHFYYSISEFTYYEKFFAPVPVIGLAYLASYLKKYGHEVKIIDDYVEKLGLKGIMENIRSYSPEMIGISCLTPLADQTVFLTKEIRKHFPEIKIVLGHRHADYFAKDFISKGIADVIVHGEGEKTLLDLVCHFENKQSLDDVKGITYQDKGNPIRNPERPLIQDLDSIPFPAWDILPLEKYKPRPEVTPGGRLNLPLLFNRGCPFHCIFCNQELGNQVRRRSVENVISEMLWCHDRFGVDGFVFSDANFPVYRDQAIEFCNELIRLDVPSKIVWTTETRPDLLDEELLELMKKAGCTKIQIGFESGSDRILKILNKRFTVQDSIKAADMVKKCGIFLYGLFIIGNPTETEEEIMATIEASKKMGLDYAKFNLFVPFPGTAAYEDQKIRKKTNGLPWICFSSYPPSAEKVVFTPDGMTPQKLIRSQKKAFLQFYFRPIMIYRHLFTIRNIRPREYWNGFLLILKNLYDLYIKKPEACR
ncbi:MAG: radical SAM protein [Candidatus Aureabacteria bacterium]|nr:radical SAM protein [Candidatus Auribacterota bacterium]